MTTRVIKSIPSGPRASCSWFRVRPRYKPCLERATYLVITYVDATPRRSAHEQHRQYCEQHVPREKVPAGLPPEEGLISTQEAADVIGVGLMTIHKWRERERGPGWIKSGNRYWYRRSEVEQFANDYRDRHGRGLTVRPPA